MADNRHGLENPIFGDATLVPVTFLEGQAPNDPRARTIFSGGGLRESLTTGPGVFSGPAPPERLIDIKPGGFIAVRRKEIEAARRYAESVRAFLTATSVLTSGKPKGFSTPPLPLHWAAIPSAARLDSQGELEINYRMVVNNFIHHAPVPVSHRLLSESWKHGSPVHGNWNISKQGPLAMRLNWR